MTDVAPRSRPAADADAVNEQRKDEALSRPEVSAGAVTGPVAGTIPATAPEQQVIDEIVRGVSPLRLGLRNFRAHRSAMVGMAILSVLYFVAIFADFVAPYSRDNQVRELQWTPPTKLHFCTESGFSWRPFIYPIRGYIDPDTFEIK